ncbi:MAG TPA: hypothetical protein VFB78_03345 [Acidimicrobiales bacterium]|nr:hypothetical protein [Acidimicrobiales bacterium]
MVSNEDFRATRQDTVVVIHEDVAIVSTRLELDGGPGIAETVGRVVVARDGNRFQLDLTVPEPQLVKNSPWLVTVLLPANSQHVPAAAEDPNNEIEIATVLDVPGQTRPVLVWRGHKDPKLPVIWDLLR